MAVIGLCGLNGGGKGVVASLLKNRGYISYSTSDILREELFKSGVESITRYDLIAHGKKMRLMYGSDVFARKVIERIYVEEGASFAKRDHLRGNYVIESIRTPGEVNFLRTIPNFVLWSVDADARLRFERLKARRRESDSQTFEDFMRIEQLHNVQEEMGLQDMKTVALADQHLVNQGSVDDLSKEIDLKLAFLQDHHF
jgi:dephospho-CoA kinase